MNISNYLLNPTFSLSDIDVLYYNTKVSSFCEGKIYGQPEMLNCLSCFFLSYLPFIGLKYSSFDNIILKNIMLLMFITGFTSFGYHWNGYFIFKLLDEIPMTLSIWLGLYHLNNITFNKTIIYLFINIYFLIMLSINPIIEFFDVFPILFLISCLSMAPFIFYYFKNIQKDFYYITEYKEAFQLAKRGMTIAITSGLSWFIIEKLCNIFFIFGHALWHVGISTGMFYIITAIQYMDYINSIQNSDSDFCFYIYYTHKYIPVIRQVQTQNI
jgi:hypothetical protein